MRAIYDMTEPQLRAEITRLEDALRAALASQIQFWEQVPSGVDYEADPENESPEDAVAHIAGLAIREARSAMEGGAK